MAEGQAVSVLVVGGGFAGSGCAKVLAKKGVRVTLVDQHNYHQFQPLLYQVATAQLSSSDIARPLRGMFRKEESVEVKMAEVTSVDPTTKTAVCDDGTTFSGDYLVLAMGTRPNFFHTPGAEEHAFPLYSLNDAEQLRSRIFGAFEDADSHPEHLDRGALNFVIVGAGATGVETAGALADLINEIMPSRYHDLAVNAARVIIVDPAPVVLAPFSKKAHEYAAKALQNEGVLLKLGLSA